MIAPALPTMSADLNTKGGDAATALLLSIYLLGYVVGPLITSPLSEIYGRVIVLQLGNLVFLLFNLVGGFAQTYVQMIFFRLLAGMGASTSLGIGGGIIGDCFRPEQRGLAVSIYNLMPLLGPAIGPIVGAFITEYSNWRWCFWSTSIADAVIQVIGLFLLEETWAPRVLYRKKVSLIRKTGNKSLYTFTDVDDEQATLLKRLRQAFARPVNLLATQIIAQALCLYMAYLFGVTFLVLSTFSSLWTHHYGYPLGTGNLNYLALAVGYTFATQVSARLNDKVYKYMNNKNGKAVPEHRLPMLAVGALVTPIGLLIYAWTAQYREPWIAVDIGVAIYAAGTFTSFQCLQLYLIDTYTTYAASATAAATILRSVFATVFPLFAPTLYQRLDYGWGTTTIAMIAIAIGWPAPMLFWKYGPVMRAKSPYAAERP